MKYAKIDSQGYMIHEETNKTQKNKLFPKHFAVRRLSSVRVIPEGTSIDTKRIDEMNEKNEFNKLLSSDKPLETVEKKVVNLDDKEFELLTPEVFESISDEGITIVSTEEDKTKNAKTPLPKPKNPPKLPE